MERKRIGQGGTAVDRLRHLVDDVLEFGVFALFFENVQALQHRQTGGAHGREHTRETGEVFVFDARAYLDLDFGGLFLEAYDDQAAAQEQGFGFGLVLGF